MATITLYAGKINQMPGLINEVKKSVVDYKSELSALRKKTLNINRSVCNLDEVISSIQASSQTQDRKIDSLEKFCSESEKFISEVIRIDEEVAELINKRKENFYKEYYYLKPESEKSGWEKIKDGLKSVAEWCKENWKSIAKIVAAAVVITGLGIAAALTGGILGVILAGAFWGALAGGLIGGAVGGIAAAINGGSFLEGFADGALSGAISGAVTGAACAGLGALGALAGKSIQCMSTVGKAINVTSKVTAALSFGMDGFDMLAMGISLFDPSNALVEFNRKLHSNALYNGFQIAVNALAVFSAGAASTMKCFVAGTMILTVAGLVAIENIKAGDKVIATNPETFEVAEKTVLETYVRETTELLHLTINGEVIKTTFEHPFYVKDVGFVEAVNLQVGDKLVDSRGNVLVVEEKKLEITGEPVKVYNFKVDDFHTYHVGNKGILVHNANKYVKGTRSTQLTFDEALKKLDKSGLRPGQTEISKSRVMEIVENYDPMKAQSSVYTDSTGRYLVEGHHTTVANTMLGKGSGVNMNIPTQQIPSATNVYWTKKWYEFWKTQIKVTK
ncbi:polymorphic toxin-type HINT domain-containing protein [Acetivibrio thermocellus]|uniref:HINT domain-containing protein n=1 Tax=Acetivibrio thermocellus TaxID=1515 RepID=UPI0021ADCF57|nr:polymorphic toxin-type HINT domain-containing protein [Acetivibrio thermocellus]UWV46603.1 polymorphic toxin-type HINT domain-containing protein [Acetivibrio thermocellus]